MALRDLSTGLTRSFTACSRYIDVDHPITVVPAQSVIEPRNCRIHGVPECAETFYSGTDLVSMTWRQMLGLRRYWRRMAADVTTDADRIVAVLELVKRAEIEGWADVLRESGDDIPQAIRRILRPEETK